MYYFVYFQNHRLKNFEIWHLLWAKIKEYDVKMVKTRGMGLPLGISEKIFYTIDFIANFEQKNIPHSFSYGAPLS